MIMPSAPNPENDRERLERLLEQLADRFSITDPEAAQAEILEIYDRWSLPNDGEFVLHGQLFGAHFRASGTIKPSQLRGPNDLVRLLAGLVDRLTQGIDQFMQQHHP
jgi:hypothetical protein